MNFLVFLLYLCTCNIASCFVFALDIAGDCQKECNTNLYELGSTGDVNCNDTCRVSQCSFGCAMWKEAASSSCDDVCNQTFERQVTHTKYLHCNIGCHFAGSLYIQSIKDALGETPSAPVLVADTQTNVSVGVRWKGPSVPLELPVSYLVQWKYESVPGVTWEYYRPKVPITEATSQIIEGLQPYTKYKFRIAWIILSKHDLIFSKESVCISTLPYGPPSVAPSITAVSNVDSTRVSVTWDPPRFPNGPILSYIVHLYQHDKGSTLIKDIPGPNPDNFFIFSNLQSNTTYTVAVACRNSVGEGPRATQDITTLSGPLVDESTGAFLIIADADKVVKRNLQNMMEEVLYTPVNSSVHITGMASHSRGNLFFVSDSSGDIHRMPIIYDAARNQTVITPSELQAQVTRLSVDWLNDKLYFVEKRQISRCDFDGNNYEVVVAGLNRYESDLKVDPYYGYLYWVASGSPSGGLYRIDLEELGTAVQIQNDSQLLVQDSHLSALAIDHQNFCILIANNKENTVYAVSLSGSELVDVRHNTQQPKFQGTKAMTIYKDLLYWTTADQVYEEEHLKDRYYHNSIFATKTETPFVALDIVHSEAQPVPVPVNPVTNVQALFHNVQARVTWLRPRPLGGLGRGAWQQWHYEISVNDSQHDGTLSRTNITETSYTLTGLEQNTSYSVKVRAYSRSGTGPWSRLFTGTTLKSATEKGSPHILWSSKGLLKSDMVGNNVETVISWSNLDNSQVIDIAWYNELLFINTNDSKVFVYNTSDHLSPNLLPNISSAISVAVDWLGRKIYWSNGKQQMISRANLDGKQVEPLPILTIAKELNIDSVNGHIYWTTSHSIECARLNGEEPRKYFQTGFFSGRKVMGLTLDHDHKRVIWMVWSSEGVTVYQAPMASYYPVTREKIVNTIVTEYVEPFAEDALQGSIRYFSDHLYWLRNPNEAVVSDLSGQNAAHLFNSGLVDLKSLAIVDATLQPYPNNLTSKSIEVVPNAVDSTTINVNGVWKDFNISWNKVSNVNHGQVFYEIGIDDETDDYGSSVVTVSEYPYYVYPHLRLLPPYSKITLSVRAYSYWGSAPRTVKTVYSPMSAPSEPLNPRVFVTSNTAGTLDVEFRWSPPKRPNGIILGYVVTVWNSDKNNRKSLDPIWEENILGQNKLVYVSNHLSRNSTYIFQVRAYTEVGEGPQSEIVEAKTSYESPIPKLLVAKENAISLIDMDNHDETTLTIGVANPSNVAYLWLDGTVFWLDQNANAIFRSNLNGTNRTKLQSLIFSGNSLNVDWVGRRLYWSEVDEISRNSSIWSLDIDRKDNPKAVLNTGTRIGAIAFDPFTSTLLWTSIGWNGVGTMMTCKPDGSQLSSLFSTSNSKENHRVERDSHAAKHEANHKPKKSKATKTCNCPNNVVVASAMTLDTTSIDSDERRLFFVDEPHKLLWTSDLEGCDCQLLLNGSNYGFPPTSITVDFNRIYWSYAVSRNVYSIKKPNPKSENSANDTPIPEVFDGVRSIEAFGSHLQPYPDVNCLTPLPNYKAPVIENVTDTTITLQIDAFTRHSQNCENVSIASVLYTIYYVALKDTDSVDTCDTNATSCLTLDTYKLTDIVTNLEPYTTYSFRVAVSNFYTKTRSEPGPATIQRTAESVPPKPTNVTVTVVTPDTVTVSWDSSVTVNGPKVNYTVYWRRQPSPSNTVSVTSNKNYFNNGSDTSNHLHDLVKGLDPSQEYAFWVRATASSGGVSNQSNEVLVQMFDNPNSLQCNNVTSTSLLLSWKSPDTSIITKHALKYKKVSDTSEIVIGKFEATVPGHNYTFVVQNLVPKSRYIFSLVTIYNSSELEYHWPKGDKFTYETSGDLPGIPGIPEVVGNSRDTYKVLWRPSDARGGMQLAYILEAKRLDENAESEFEVVYNDSDNKWTVFGLDLNTDYLFRVCAYNEYGVSNFSENSLRRPFFQASAENEPIDEEQLEIVLGATVPVLFLLLVGISYVLFKVHRKREKEKKILQEIVHNAHNPDLELATLRDLPQNQNFIHENNALYALSDIPSDAELAALPHVSSNQIVLIKFLGCGAFGEVFEGIARTLPGETETDIRVAIKTLRKGATDHEKTEFLKEAQLMSNFKHEHILSLLGVCLDNDPNFLILELMEGGDLLSYLRNNRPTAFSPSMLSSQDLISICVDVAHGCCHLEDMHFIHRDLAARNCLVSSHDSSQRTVKIGDFGLARDIYKNDYYRKEGEGLLPVRWMSPESLVDGVFTSQSDVWAFGVLLWEVMTLGQQPYPARTNVEVLHYVRGGGRLDKPDNCPDDLHQLMLKCWSYNPSERPTFRYCLDKLQELRRRSSQTPSTTNNNSVHNQNYLGRQEAAGGVDNLAYTSDENVRCSLTEEQHEEARTGEVPSRAGSSVPRTRVSEAETASICSTTSDTRNGCRRLTSETDNDDDTIELLEKQPENTGSHRYLELLYDNDLSNVYDEDGGYEVPLSSSIRRKGPFAREWAPVKEDQSSPHSTYGIGDIRARTMSDNSTLGSTGSIPPMFTDGVPRVSDEDNSSHTSQLTDSDVKETDDAKQLAASYGKVMHRSKRRGASQPLLSIHLGDDDEMSRIRCQNRGSVASVGDIEMSTKKGIFIDGQLFCVNSAPLTDASSEHHRNLGHHHHRQHKPWRESSVSLGTDASSSSDGIGATDPSTDATSSHLSGISALSAYSSSSTSGIDMDYAPTSAWC